MMHEKKKKMDMIKTINKKFEEHSYGLFYGLYIKSDHNLNCFLILQCAETTLRYHFSKIVNMNGII